MIQPLKLSSKKNMLKIKIFLDLFKEIRFWINLYHQKNEFKQQLFCSHAIHMSFLQDHFGP